MDACFKYHSYMKNQEFSLSKIIKIFCLFFGVMGIVNICSAGVIVGGTRVVYDDSNKEATISVKNPDKMPYLIQSWVENFDSHANGTVPFIVTPPLFRLDSEQENVLRILKFHGQLAENKESLFWLNIKSIPEASKTTANQLQIAVKTQIKLIYRPAGLAKNASGAYKLLKFSRQGNSLLVTNPTPYFISFYSVEVGGHKIKDAKTLAPESSLTWPLPSGSGNQVSWQVINDFGGITQSLKMNI